MPIPKRDEYSGALIFHPTPEEVEVKQLKSELESMKEELAQKISELDRVLSSAKTRRK